MKNLYSDLKIFKFDYGESHFIVAENLEDAEKYYNNDVLGEYDEYLIAEIRKDGYTVLELSKDSNIKIAITEDKELEKVSNRYRLETEKIDKINIFDLLYWDILTSKLQDRKLKIPYVIASSIY